jgi:hypothetical protein
MKMEMQMQIRRPGALSDESFEGKIANAEREQISFETDS